MWLLVAILIPFCSQVNEKIFVRQANMSALIFIYPGTPPSTETPVGEYPTLVEQTSGKIVPVVQAYAYTKYLGYLALTFDDMVSNDIQILPSRQYFHQVIVSFHREKLNHGTDLQFFLTNHIQKVNQN
jgi:hypothetical protein